MGDSGVIKCQTRDVFESQGLLESVIVFQRPPDHLY